MRGRRINFVQYYDPFLKDWFVVRENLTVRQIKKMYRIFEDCGVRTHCSIYGVVIQ